MTTTTASSPIELNRLRRPPPLSAVHFFTEEHTSPPPSASASAPAHFNASSSTGNGGNGNGNGGNEPFPPSHSYEEEGAIIYPLWKRNLYRLLEQPTSSSSAFVVHMFSIFLIVFSAFITVLETVPAVHSISTRVWFGLETSIVALFTVEYIARCVAWSNTWQSLFSWQFCALLACFSFCLVF